ncbi:MAG: hypothetical protein SF187_00275 [Deltaproteobacteria bacterium]|nr:hypothetical protein [Deltaproteobacteria bacterium]
MVASSVRFRRSLPAEQVEADGYVFFEVRKPDGEAFRLYDFEFKVATELDGRGLSEVQEAVLQRHGLALSEEQLAAFINQLNELGLLDETNGPRDDAAPPDEVDGAQEPLTDAVAVQRHDEDDDNGLMDDEPTAGHGLAALKHAAASLSQPEPRPAMPAKAQGWHEAEPTALMNSMSDLLAVSRARTGETPMYQGDADAPLVDEPLNPRESGAPLPPATWPEDSSSMAPGERTEQTTQDLKAAAAQVPRPPTQIEEEGAALAAGVGITLPPSTPQRAARRWWLWALVAVALAAAIGFAVFKFVLRPSGTPVSVDTMLPAPTAVYRWFDTTGILQPPAPATLTLPAGGKLVEVRDAGSKYRAGDVLALTDEGKRQSNEIDHLRERIAYYQQMLEAMTAEGNKPEMRQAEIKLKEKRSLLDEALAAFAQVAIVASTDGEIDSVLKKVGDKVKPAEAVLTLKAHQARAVFKLPHDDAEQAQRLAFCRVSLADVPADCEFVGTDAEDTVVVELPAGVQGNPGQAVSLAKARFDGVFAVPASAVLHVGNSERLFVAAPSGRVEVRAVAIADRTEREALIAQGLDVGDAVILDARPELAASPRVHVAKRVLQ